MILVTGWRGPRVEFADRESFAKHRPQAALTVARPELLVDGSDDAFRQMIHDALAFASRLQAGREEPPP